MKSTCKNKRVTDPVTTLAVASLQLIGLSIHPSDQTRLTPQLVPAKGNIAASIETESTCLRKMEASHLEVYATCKGGRAAFAPVIHDEGKTSHEIEAFFSLLA